MTPFSPHYEQALQLMADLAESRLDHDGRNRLETLLWNHPELRELYIDYQLLISNLHWTCSQAENLTFGMPWSLAEPAEESDSTQLIGKIRIQEESLPSIGRFYGVVRGRRRLRLAPRLVGWAASLLLVGYFSAMAWLLISDRIRHADQHGQLASQPSSEQPAVLIHADDADWKSSVAGHRLKNRTLLVRSGLAELEFVDGAKVTIEGPAEFEVRSSNHGYLRNGRLAAHVPTQAVGFEIETPTARVVDLGTDFDLEANAKETKLAVITGKVDLFPRDGRGDYSKSTAGSPRRVTAGEAVSVTEKINGAITVEEAKFDATRFSVVAGAVARNPASSGAVAYHLSEITSGNQRDFQGAVGLDFDVRTPIRVSSLGVFDHQSDGIDPSTAPTVQLWSRAPGNTLYENSDDVGRTMLASVQFTDREGGELKQGHRFKSLPEPIDLPAGAYTVVAYGISAGNPFFASEDFDYDVDFSSDPGWVGANNTSLGNRFGWSASTNSAHGRIGEIGGVFTRLQSDCYYGDTQLTNGLKLDGKIAASGRFDINKVTPGWAGDGDGSFFIGHFSTIGANKAFMGLEFRESGGDDKVVRVLARCHFHRRGTFGGATSTITSISVNGQHTFSYEYDPDQGGFGRLTVHIDEQPLLTADLSDGDRTSDISFDGFGMGIVSILNTENDPMKTIDAYLDDVSYSGLRETRPRSVNVTESSRPLRRMDTGHDSILSIGSRWGKAEPGTFPKMSGDRPRGVVAASFEFNPIQTPGSREQASGTRQ